MTVTETTPTSAEQILAASAALRPVIAERAAEIESAGRVPDDLLTELIAAGCFRLVLPASHGGAGGELASALQMFQSLASADASVGWNVMIGSCAWSDLSGLPRATFDAIFDGSDVIVAGAFAPTGTAEPLDGAYRVSGRWGFASGCRHATWVYGNCIEGFEDGGPLLRAAVFAPDEIAIEDTWHVSGLNGTGSHHFRAEAVTVAAERTFVPLHDEPCIDTPVVRVPTPSLIALAIAGTAIGVASGALDDIVELAEGKLPLLASTPLMTNALFQHELATADAELRAARAVLVETAEEAWSTAVDGARFTMRQRADARSAAVWITQRAAAITDFAYRSGGGTSIYSDCPLQRRFRDIHAITQHFLVKPDTLTAAGAVYAGQDPGLPVF
jgi:alkylation response protein AidB-like acyl-CoA dehydrogenase